MKKYIFIVWVICAGVCFSVTVSAQRNFPGDKALSITGGTVDGLWLRDKRGAYSGFTALEYSKTNHSRSKWVFGTTYLRNDLFQESCVIPRREYLLTAGYELPIISNRKGLFTLSAGVHATVGYEKVDWEEYIELVGVEPENSSGFPGGAILSLKAESYISNRIILAAGIRQQLMVIRGEGRYSTLFGIGIGMVIN